MWEDNLGKVKTKRSKSKPYERPKSILRRVTDSVTGLLPQPSWLASWLHPSGSKEEETNSGDEEEPVPSTSSESADGSRTVRDSTRESFIFQRPPGLRKDNGNGSASIELPPAPLNTEPAPPLASGVSAREISVQTINGDDDSHSESTSGCSSLLPHPDHRNREARDVDLNREPLNIDSSSLQMLGASLSKSFATDMKTNSRPSRKTLSLHTFSHDNSLAANNVESSFNNDLEGQSGTSFYSKDEMSSLNQSATKRNLLPQPSAFNSKRPRFNITTFGPVVVGPRKSNLNDSSIADSPFYAGRTTYGGASAYRRATLQPSLTPYPDVRKRLQARPSSVCSAPPTPAGRASGLAAASSTTVGSASTASNVVLSSSAQKILHALEAMSTPVADAKRIPTTSRRSSSASLQEEEPSFTGYGLSRRRPHLGPPTSKLPISRPAIVVSRASPMVIPSTSSVTSSVLAASTPISSQAGGKMRHRVSAPVRDSIRSAQAQEELDEPELPTVSLPLSTLPSFSLLPPPPLTSSTVKKATTSSVVAQPAPLVQANFAIFSSTSTTGSVTTSVASASALNGHGKLPTVSSQSQKTEARPTFTFAAPLVTVSSSMAAAVAAKPSSKSLTFNFSQPLCVKGPTDDDLEIVESKTCQPKSDTDSSPFKPAAELKTGGSVMDILRKEPVAQTTPLTTPLSSSVKGFGDKFKPPSDSWTCSVCCISNAKDKTACAACETPNPDNAKANSAPLISVPTSTKSLHSVAPPPTFKGFEGFGDKFKMSSSQWECDTCMVRNLDCDNMCKSCETPKPGSAKALPVAKPMSTFKFGVPAAQEKSAPVSTVATTEDKASASKSESTTGFKFGSAVSDATDKKDVPPSGGFKFGSTLDSTKKTEESSGGFKFGSTVEPVVTAPATASQKKDAPTGGFIFGASVSSGAASEIKFGALSAPTPVVDASKKVEATVAPTPAGGFQFGATSSLPAAVEPTKKPESTLNQLLDAPVSAAPPTSSSFGGFNVAATTVTSSAKSMPILSFGGSKAEGVDTLKPASELKTGSVLDILGKKPTTETSAIVTSSAPSLSFGAGQSKGSAGLFNFGKPAVSETSSTGGVASPFSFNGPSIMGSGTSSTSEDQPAAKKSSFGLASTTSTASIPAAFSFGSAPATVTSTAPSLSLFKPATTSAAPAFSFGQATSTSATTSAPSFGSVATAASTAAAAPAAPSLFFTAPSVAATQSSAPAAAVSSATTTAPAAAGVFSFGQTSSAAPSSFSFGSSAAPASSASIFQFGSKEAPKPGGFAFNTPAPTVPAPSATASTPFTFGGAAAAPATTAASTPFTFGSAAAAPVTTTQSEAPKSVFSFGTSSTQPPSTTASVPAFGTFSAPTQSPFAFGALGGGATTSETTASITPFGAASAASSTPFGSLSSASGFGSSGAAAPAATPFGFNASATPAAAAPMFNAPAFNFGASAQQPAVQPASSGVFSFGSAASSGQQLSSGQGFGSFNAPSSFSAPSFNPPAFNAPADASSGGFGANPFDMSSGPSGTKARVIRKAIRRR